MKTMKLWALSLLFVMGLGFASAQSNLAQSAEVESLLEAGKIGEAVNTFEKFKQEKTKEKAESFDLFLLEIRLYRDVANGFYPIKDGSDIEQYKSTYADLKKQILKKYPNQGDAYVMQVIDGDATPEDVVKFTTKALELEPQRLDLYGLRAQAYREMGKEEEAAADEAKMMGN